MTFSSAHSTFSLRPLIIALSLVGFSAISFAQSKVDPASGEVVKAPSEQASKDGGKAGNSKATKPPKSEIPALFASTAELKAFDEVVDSATVQTGFVPIWREDQHLVLELRPDQFNQPFLLSINTTNSLGERGIYANQMGPSWVVEFRKMPGNTVHLIALNTDHVANNLQMKGVLKQSFSASLLASASILSAPHPQRGSVIVDGSFMLGDLAAQSTRLESAFRLPYAADRANSFFEKVRVDESLSAVGVQIHYTMPRLPGQLPPGAPPVSTPSIPDPRSLFVGFVYNFLKLPDSPMATRPADPRLGHFTDAVVDLSNDTKVNPVNHLIKRWRLEKKDPHAALSDPKSPIVYWLDKNIPLMHRAAVREGVLEWNKAFERIGFSNAIVVKQQADSDDWEGMEARHASIRWVSGSDLAFAAGPSHSDPRTGEILNAHIMMSDAFSRRARRLVGEELPNGFSIGSGMSSETRKASLLAHLNTHAGEHGAACDHSNLKAMEIDFAMDLMEAKVASSGPMQPQEVEAFVRSAVKEVTMHEVGHTLGLRHNFKASTVRTPEQLADKSFTSVHGIASSVMDYSGFNLAAPGESQGTVVMETLGAYDFWAIEYAYKEMDPGTQWSELKSIAARSTEPELVYASDEDAAGVDPFASRFDLSNDPLRFFKKRFSMVRGLWDRAQSRRPAAGEDPARQRRLLLTGFKQLAQFSELAVRYIGGMHSLRDLPGSARPSFEPVDPKKQFDALNFIGRSFLSADSFEFEPQFLSRVRADQLRGDVGVPVSISGAVLTLQAGILDQMMSPLTAQRVLELPAYTERANRGDLLTLSHLYGTLQKHIWSELSTGSDIGLMRRNLQREHLKRMHMFLTQTNAPVPADAISLVRMQAVALQKELKRTLSKGRGLSVEARAHLEASVVQITGALGAQTNKI